MSRLRMWQRHHQGGLIAEVTPVGGIGVWVACAGNTVGRIQVPGHFALLTEAQARADQLVADSYDHVCDVQCGMWTAVEPRTEDRDNG
jgi:hypothetical protein